MEFDKLGDLAKQMDKSIDVMVDADAAVYKRARDLPKLIAVWPTEIDDYTISGTIHVIERLRKAQQAIGILAMTQHWSYDFNRHVAVLAALKAERRNLAMLQGPALEEAAE